MSEPVGIRLLWRIWCLRWRYAFRDPYDIEGNHALVADIDRLERRNALYE